MVSELDFKQPEHINRAWSVLRDAGIFQYGIPSDTPAEISDLVDRICALFTAVRRWPLEHMYRPDGIKADYAMDVRNKHEAALESRMNPAFWSGRRREARERFIRGEKRRLSPIDKTTRLSDDSITANIKRKETYSGKLPSRKGTP